jgi:hypothetical protein
MKGEQDKLKQLEKKLQATKIALAKKTIVSPCINSGEKRILSGIVSLVGDPVTLSDFFFRNGVLL